MYFWLAISAVVIAFLLPFGFSRPHEPAPVDAGFGLAVIVFFIILIGTWEESYTQVDRSNLDFSRLNVDGKKILVVEHPKGSYRTNSVLLYENFEDTTQVEVKIKKTENIFWQSDRLIVEGKY